MKTLEVLGVDPGGGYEALASAIVEQAILDYRKALRNIKAGRNIMANAAMRDDCERFFRSEYFKLLTDLDGGRIMEMIRKEVRENEYR